MDFEKEKSQEKKEKLDYSLNGNRENLFTMMDVPMKKELSFKDKVGYFLSKDMFIQRQLWLEELEKHFRTSPEDLKEKYFERASKVKNSQEAYELLEELDKEVFNAGVLKNPKPEPESKFWEKIKKITDVLCGDSDEGEEAFLEYIRLSNNAYRHKLNQKINKVDLKLNKYALGVAFKKMRERLAFERKKEGLKEVNKYVGNSRYIVGIFTVIFLSIIFFMSRGESPIILNPGMVFISIWMVIYSVVLSQVSIITLGYIKYIARKKTQKNSYYDFLGGEVVRNKKIIEDLLNLEKSDENLECKNDFEKKQD